MLGNRKVGQRLNMSQKIVVVAMDLIFLAALALGVYLGQQDPENLTAIFLRTFIPLALGTLIISRILLKKLRTDEEGDPGLAAEAVESRGNL